MTTPTIPRGLRLRNPGNIRHGAPWRGLATLQPDPDFCTFVCDLYGLRAIVRILLTYAREDVRTVSAIAARWAPPVENDTSAWARVVAAETGHHPYETLDTADPYVLATLQRGITRAEQGVMPYLACQYRDAVTLALAP